MTAKKLQSKLFPENGKWSFIISLDNGTQEGYFLCGGTRATKSHAEATMNETMEEYRKIYSTQKAPA